MMKCDEKFKTCSPLCYLAYWPSTPYLSKGPCANMEILALLPSNATVDISKYLSVIHFSRAAIT